MARKILATLDSDAGEEEQQQYPIVARAGGKDGAFTTPVYLLRDDPWKDLCRQCGVKTVPALLSRVPAGDAKRKAVRMFRSATMFQFDGSAETGMGQGVERETVEKVCNAMVARGPSHPAATASTSTSTVRGGPLR